MAQQAGQDVPQNLAPDTAAGGSGGPHRRRVRSTNSAAHTNHIPPQPSPALTPPLVAALQSTICPRLEIIAKGISCIDTPPGPEDHTSAGTSDARPTAEPVLPPWTSDDQRLLAVAVFSAYGSKMLETASVTRAIIEVQEMLATGDGLSFAVKLVRISKRVLKDAVGGSGDDRGSRMFSFALRAAADLWRYDALSAAGGRSDGLAGDALDAGLVAYFAGEAAEQLMQHVPGAKDPMMPLIMAYKQVKARGEELLYVARCLAEAQLPDVASGPGTSGQSSMMAARASGSASASLPTLDLAAVFSALSVAAAKGGGVGFSALRNAVRALQLEVGTGEVHLEVAKVLYRAKTAAMAEVARMGGEWPSESNACWERSAMAAGIVLFASGFVDQGLMEGVAKVIAFLVKDKSSFGAAKGSRLEVALRSLEGPLEVSPTILEIMAALR